MAKFVKADSTNLPRVEGIMIVGYMNSSSSHNAAEIRGAKALMSSRSDYVDTSVGYVEVRRIPNICEVCAKVIPEHRIRDKAYLVTITINEKDDEISDTKCEGCPAALGGCKHTLVVLFWLSKRTEEPSCTSVQCYWKKPTLLDARTLPVESRHMFKNSKTITLEPKDNNVLKLFEAECKNRKISDSLITSFCQEKVTLDKFNIFDLMLKFIEKEKDHSYAKYKLFIDSEISDEIKGLITKQTFDQADCKLWHTLREFRITASQIYDIAHCKVDGCLVKQILGGYKIPETVAIKRGKKLESDVLKEVEKKLKIKTQKSGLIMINGLIGASPDALCNDFVIEIKCPSTVKTMENYISNKVIKPKYKAQICLQMIAAIKKKGLFCVADPKFEENKKKYLFWVTIDKKFTDDLIQKASNFWEKYIYPKILHSAQF